MKKYFVLGVSMLTVVACLYITSCKTKKETTKTACSSNPTYTADVKKILDEYCGTTCHNATKKKHGIDLSTYETSKEASANPNFLGSIRHEDGYDAMPAKHDKLDDATIEKLACWVKNGMPK